MLGSLLLLLLMSLLLLLLMLPLLLMLLLLLLLLLPWLLRMLLLLLLLLSLLLLPQPLLLLLLVLLRMMLLLLLLLPRLLLLLLLPRLLLPPLGANLRARADSNQVPHRINANIFLLESMHSTVKSTYGMGPQGRAPRPNLWHKSSKRRHCFLKAGVLSSKLSPVAKTPNVVLPTGSVSTEFACTSKGACDKIGAPRKRGMRPHRARTRSWQRLRLRLADVNIIPPGMFVPMCGGTCRHTMRHQY
jgi:hypothetical protein